MTLLTLKMVYSHNKDEREEARKHIGDYVLSGCDYFDLLGSPGMLINVTEDSFQVQDCGQTKITDCGCIAFLDMVV